MTCYLSSLGTQKEEITYLPTEFYIVFKSIHVQSQGLVF